MIRNSRTIQSRMAAGLVAAVFSVSLSSCAGALTEAGPSGVTGLLVSLDEELEAIQTRATPKQLGKPGEERFTLILTRDRQGSGERVYEGGIPKGVIPVPEGSYTVSATCGTDEVLAFDSPFYQGSANAQVKEGSPTAVSIPCSVGNCLLSVAFKNQGLFEEQFSSWGVLVSTGGKSLDITPSNNERSAYFKDGTILSLTFHALLAGNGREVSLPLSDPSLPLTYKAGTHTILTLSASEPASGAVLTVEKVEVRKVDIPATIPMEWLPKPSVEGFLSGDSIELYETQSAPGALLAYSAHSPLQDLELVLDLKDPDLASHNSTYLLSLMSEDDRASLAGIGVGLPALGDGSKSGAVDLCGLASRLKTDKGAETLNGISFRLKANNRWSSESPEKYTIRVLRPEFSVDVLPGNVWTRELSAEAVSVSKGDAERIGDDLVYQFSSDGGATWQAFSDGARQVFASAPEDKSIKVRACYRGCIPSSNVVDVVLETPHQLPNSDLESWQAQKMSGSSIFLWKAYYDFLPYASGEKDVWWATNNKRSRDFSVSAVDVTTSPCVSYSESVKHGGNRSALIYTSGHGGGYASTITIVYPQGAFAGSLFIGSYDWNDGRETLTPGHGFSSRPSALTFWYRYIPKGNDRFKALVELRSGGDVIATGTFISEERSSQDQAFVQARAEISYIDESRPATSIFVQFLSTTKTQFSKSDFNVGESIVFPVMGGWNAHIGSKLYIDDLNLVYSR